VSPVTGPYEIQEPERFFLPDFYNYSFNPEVRSLECASGTASLHLMQPLSA
jgi:hypothetical protein